MMDWLVPTEPGTTLLDATLQWRPHWSAGLLWFVFAAAVVLALWTYRSRRLDLPTRWRIALAGLRIAVFLIPLMMLMQPHVSARLERQDERELVVLVDHSRSMTVRDSTGETPRSRTDQALAALTELRANSDGVDVRWYAFGGEAQAIESPEALAALPTSDATAIGDVLATTFAECKGRNVAGVVMLSDGGDNASTVDRHPVSMARAFAAADIPVHTVLVGSEQPRDVSVQAMADAAFAFAGDPVSLKMTIENQRLDGEAVSVSLIENDRVIETRDVILGAQGQPVVERFTFKPAKPGEKRCRVEVTSVPGELTEANNVSIATIQVIEEPIRVLYVEHWPRWQYQFLRNAMRRDHRFESRLVLLTEDPATLMEQRQTASFPATYEELEAFDVIVMGDLAPQDLSLQQWQWVHDHVTDNGAGFVAVSGPRYMPTAFVDTPIAPLLPFERVVPRPQEDIEPFKPQVTQLGTHHPLMRLGFGDDPLAVWKTLPSLGWYVEVADIKPGAVVLAERPADVGGQPHPLVLMQRIGKGASLFVGTDETWKWRYELGNRYFYGFWAHAIQHVGMRHRVSEFQQVRISTAANRVAPDVPTTINVAMDAALIGSSIGEMDSLTLIAEPDDGSATMLTLKAVPDAPLVYNTDARFSQPGNYRLYVEGYEDRGDATLEVTNDVVGDRELADPQVRPDVLRQIADLTSGQYTTLQGLPAVLEGINLEPVRYRWSQSVPLWDGWVTLIVLAMLLSVEWAVRKWFYLP